MRKTLLSTMLLASVAAVPATAASLDVSDAKAYSAAHRVLAESLHKELQADPDALLAVRADLARHARELPLRELCRACDGAGAKLGVDDAFEPSVWLHEPAPGKALASDETLIAFPPAGDDSTWTQVDALAPDGTWITLDATTEPAQPVLVVRVNGALTFERQVAKANVSLREAGLQAAPSMAKSGNNATTRLESIRLQDDKEPWVSGGAEIYALTIGLQPANQPQIAVVDMPWLDHDGRTYSPRQILLYWSDFAYGAADILIYEHDDNTNYQTLVQALITAAGELGNLAGKSEIQAIAEIVNKVVAVMPSGWFSNDDDYVDSFHTVLKTQAESRFGAAGNAQATMVPYQLPAN